MTLALIGVMFFEFPSLLFDVINQLGFEDFIIKKASWILNELTGKVEKGVDYTFSLLLSNIGENIRDLAFTYILLRLSTSKNWRRFWLCYIDFIMVNFVFDILTNPYEFHQEKLINALIAVIIHIILYKYKNEKDINYFIDPIDIRNDTGSDSR